MLNKILSKLKPWGGHHGLPLLALIWVAWFVNPTAGIVAGLLGIGFYGGKEYQEWKQRGTMEWPDIITPAVFAIISIWIMRGM